MNARNISVAGDSLTNPENSYGHGPNQYWTHRLAVALDALGCKANVRNFANSGAKTKDAGTGDLLYDIKRMWKWGVPELSILFIGTNDIGTYSTAESTLHLRAAMQCLKFGAITYAAAQTNLPAGSPIGERRVVLADGSTTGGVALSTNWPGVATLTGTASGSPTVWECRNSLAGVKGWGRIADSDTTPTHCPRFLVVSDHYRNYSGGDTTTTPLTGHDDLTGIRKAQIDAAAAEGAVYCDLYAFLKARIVAGADVQDDAAWHVASGNQHLSPYGHDLVAQCVLASISAQTGWLTALS